MNRRIKTLIYLSLVASCEVSAIAQLQLISNWDRGLLEEFFDIAYEKPLRRRSGYPMLEVLRVEAAVDAHRHILDQVFTVKKTGPWPIWVEQPLAFASDSAFTELLVAPKDWMLSKTLQAKVAEAQAMQHSRLPERLKPHCVPISMSSYGILVNWTALRSRGEDFVSASHALQADSINAPSFREMIIMPDPKQDHVMAAVLAAVVAERGILEGWRLIEGWFLNLKKLETDRRRSLKAVLDGEGAATFLADDLALRLIADSGRQDIEFVSVGHPKFMFHDCLLVSSLASAAHPSLGVIVNHLLSDAMQRRLFLRKLVRGGPQSRLIGRLPVLAGAYAARRDLRANLLDPFAIIESEKKRREVPFYSFDASFVVDLVDRVFINHLAEWRALGYQLKGVQSSILRRSEMFSRRFLPRETELISYAKLWHLPVYRQRLLDRLDREVAQLMSEQGVFSNPL